MTFAYVIITHDFKGREEFMIHFLNECEFFFCFEDFVAWK